ncbi:MAG: ABC transporter permease [Pseudomonadota bacterium]
MSHLSTVFFKEIRDNFRDRRTMLSALVFGPLFGPIMFAVLISMTLKQATDSKTQPLELAVIGADYAPNLINYLESEDTEIEPIDLTTDEAVEAVKDGTYELVLIVDEAFGEQWTDARSARVSLVMDNSDSSIARKGRRARGMISGYSRQIGAMRLLARGVDPSVMRPITIDEIDTSTPSGRAGLILGMLSYFLLFAMLAGGMYLAIDTTAGERERGSLEPLLTLPVKRSTLLIGKLLATCLFMSVSLALALIAFAVVLQFMPLQQLGMSVDFGPKQVITAFVVTAPFALIGAALLTVVASFTKTFKEAQSYMNITMLLPTLPIIVAAVNNLRPSLTWMTVPSMSQHLLILDLVKGEPLQPMFVAVSIGSSLIIGTILTLIAIHLYKREGLLG